MFDNAIISKYTFLIVLLYKFSKATALFISFSIFIHLLDMFCIERKKKQKNQLLQHELEKKLWNH